MEPLRQQAPEDHRVLRIRVSLNGRPLREYTFDQETVIVGRDPACDVVLDNIGVSRHHVKFERSPGGNVLVQDLESANGTLFNDQPLKRDYIYNNSQDVLQIGKFTLWVNREAGRREAGHGSRPGPVAFAHTTVLSAAEIQKLEQEARHHRVSPVLKKVEAPAAAATPDVEAAAPPARRPLPWGALTMSFLLGVVLGALGLWVALR